MRSRSSSPSGWRLVIFCLAFLVLPSSQNDLVISTVAQHCETPSDKLQDNNQEVEQLDVTGPDLISDEHLMKQDNLEAFPVLVLEPPPSQDKISQDEVSQPLELVTSEDKTNLTLAELTVPVDNFDADLLIPSSEILSFPENPEVSGYIEVPSNDSVALKADGVKVDLPNPNVLNVTNNATRNNESGSGEDDIPSFSEWTLKVLAEEEKSGANGSTGAQVSSKPSTAPKLRQKNYASPDCGAKILAANSEAEHTSAVLDPARDEYFLSVCSTKIWFVIELCEAIQAQKIEIANFELFSSSPKDFRVYISDRYPRRDWAPIGEFTAVDERSIQSFPLERPFFGKFVKVELVSHHGREHFCPISLFRVYGNSEYEVLDIEEDSRSGSTSQRQEEDSTEEEMLIDVKQNSSSVDVVSTEGRNLFGSAKDAVINIVKKAAEVLGKSPTPDSVIETANQTVGMESDSKHLSSCHTSIESVNVSRVINGTLSCQWKELNFLVSLSWLQSPLLHQCKGDLPSNQTYFSFEMAFARSIWKPTTIQALCYWILPEEPPTAHSLEPLPSLESDVLPSESTTPSAEVSSVTAGGDSLIAEQPTAAIELVDLEHFEQFFAEDIESIGPLNEDLPIGTDSKELESPVEVPKLNIPQQPQQHSSQLPHQQQPQPPQQQIQHPSQQQQQQPVAPPHQFKLEQNQNQKESVFVRLSNRIKVLERNMSLSGQYLEELSRRYKRQVDDMQKTLNRTLQTLNDTLQRMSAQDEHYLAMYAKLHDEIAELKSSTHRLAEDNLILRAQTMEQHLFLMIVEVAVISGLVVFLLRNLKRPRPQLPPDPQMTSIQQAKQHETAAATLPPNFLLEVGQKVEEVNIGKPVHLSLNVTNVDVHSHKKRQQTSPAPSLADSSSSGCESAFSFPNSNHAASRDPSPEDCKKARSKLGKPSGKKHQKKKKNNLNTHATDKLSVYHAKDIKSSPIPPNKNRLKPENWEWHSRAKILAAQFIKESYSANAMRSSF